MQNGRNAFETEIEHVFLKELFENKKPQIHKADQMFLLLCCSA